MLSVSRLGHLLPSLLETAATAAARTSGFVQRHSKLSAAVFVETVVWGWLASPTASLADLVQMAARRGVTITRQGLDQRFGEAAFRLLESVLGAIISTLVSGPPVAIPLLRRFNGVYVLDSSSIRLPPELADRFPGCGGRTSTSGLAALKLQVRLDLSTGRLDGPVVVAGRVQDKVAAREHGPLPPGSLRVADLGYFSAAVFTEIAAQGSFWLSRYHQQANLLDQRGSRLDLVAVLRAAGQRLDRPVQIGLNARLEGRLLAVRVPESVAASRRRRMHADARREGRAPTAYALALADWTILLTNVPVDRMSLDEAFALYRARWQIELLFKLWKSEAGLGTSPSATTWRVLCELYAKLIAVVLQHWLLVLTCWSQPNRSWTKAAAVIRAQIPALATALTHPPALRAVLRSLLLLLRAGATIPPRRRAPATFQLLADPSLAGWGRPHPHPPPP